MALGVGHCSRKLTVAALILVIATTVTDAA